MQARVGARIEVAPRRRVLFGADYAYLAVLLAASASLHGWVVARTTVTARDSLGFARYALNLEHPPPAADGQSQTFVDVLRQTEHPPGYPTAVLVTSLAVRQILPAPLPDQMLISTQVASAVAGVLLVLPTYWLGRSLFASKFAGFAGALLFQVAPTVAHVTSDGLSEALFLLATATAAGCGVRAVRRASTAWFLLCGLAAGLGYLVRPEGLMVVLAVGAVTAGLGILRRWPRDAAAGRLTALAVGVLAVAVPYMVLIGKVSNKPSVDDAIKGMMRRSPREMLLQKATSGAEVGPALFADWYDARRDGAQVAWAAKAVLKETFKSAHYVPFVLGVIGLASCRRRVVADPGLGMIVVLGIINVAVLIALGGLRAENPYVSERHTLLLVLLACLFAGAAIEPAARALASLPQLAGLVGPCGVLAAVVLTAVPSALRPLHENRAGHLHAGKFLADKIGPDDAVIDPFCWAEWYAGRTLSSILPDPPEERLKARWVIWEPTAGTRENPHSRLPRLDAARAVVNDGKNPPRVMYHWPEDGPPELAKVVVYRQDVK